MDELPTQEYWCKFFSTKKVQPVMRKYHLITLVILLLYSFGTSNVGGMQLAAGSYDERRIKVAFIYNFMKFIDLSAQQKRIRRSALHGTWEEHQGY